MKFIVNIDYKQFGFDTIEEAGKFACTAKDRSLSDDVTVKIGVYDDPEPDDEI